MREIGLKIKAILFKVVVLMIFQVLITSNIYSNPTLSDTIDVHNYDIHLDLSNLSVHTLFGQTTIKFSPQQDNLAYIPLELWGLNLDSVFYNSTLVSSSDIQYDGMNIRIPVDGQLLTTDTAFVTVYYHGNPQVDPSGWGGFYFEGSVAYNLGVGFGADPHNLGKTWFPCVDDFIDKATYSYFIKTASNKTAVCSGVLVGITSDPVDTLKNIHHWELDLEIPTYLASVAVGSYQKVHYDFSGINNTIPVDIYVASSYVSNVAGSFTNLEGALDAFEYRFGEYIWPRIGYVGTSIGAMEHQCNIAFPMFMINGTTSGETTMAHELGHSWFGNLITASSSGDMWINEGWASYTEYIFMEEVHGIDAGKDYIRNQHADNLRLLQYSDGWIPLAGVTHDYTYSNTVYDKGADIIHSMRGYLGDSVFFNSIQSLLNEYAFSSLSIEEFRDYLSTQISGDMNSFFESHIFSSGWNHYSLDSFDVVNLTGNEYEVSVYMRQRLKEMYDFADDNRVNVTFMDENWNTTQRMVHFDGETGMESFIIDIEPVCVLVDLEEQFADATTDYYSTISEVGSLSFIEAYFKFELDQLSDSAFFRIEHNWVAPDDFYEEQPQYILSDSRYWKVDGIFPSDFEGQYKFYYNNKTNGDGYLDHTWFTYPMSADSLVILYRSSTNNEWIEVPSEKLGNSRSGWMATNFVAKGEYTLAWRDNSLSVDIVNNSNTNSVKTYPNPVNDILTVEYKTEERSILRILNSQGQIVYSKRIRAGERCLHIDTSDLAIGVYIIDFNSSNKYISNTRFVVSR